jgi:hypothetical protein
MPDALPSLAHWRRQGHFIHFRGHQLFVQQQGDGSPVLLMYIKMCRGTMDAEVAKHTSSSAS